MFLSREYFASATVISPPMHLLTYFFAIIAALVHLSFAHPLHLTPIQRSPLTFALDNVGSTNFALESSTDLETWIPNPTIEGRTNENQLFVITNYTADALFYRARGPVMPRITVRPEIDETQVSVLLVTRERGGFIALTNDAGVIFTFLAPSNVVIDPVPVTLTIVTNFLTFPAAEPQAAVLLSPDGFEFYGAATLQITFPTNFPLAQMTSFGLTANGSQLYGLPSLMTNRTVTIPITHFSAVGAGSFTQDEQRRLYDQSLNDVELAIGNENAKDAANARKSGDHQGAIEKMQKRLQQYFEQYIKPLIRRARTDCGVGEVLVQKAIAVEKIGERLNIPIDFTRDPDVISALSESLCECVKEALEKCTNGTATVQQVLREAMAARKQMDYLEGSLHCPEADKLFTSDLHKLPCAPKWVGIVEYSSTAKFQTNMADPLRPGGRITQDYLEEVRFTMAVVKAVYEDTARGEEWTLYLKGAVTGTASDIEKRTFTEGCESFEYTDHHLAADSREHDYELFFVITNGTMHSFQLTPAATSVDGKHVMRWRSERNCPDGSGSIGDSSHEALKTSDFIHGSGTEELRPHE